MKQNYYTENPRSTDIIGILFWMKQPFETLAFAKLQASAPKRSGVGARSKA
jgi:hypothetical protein